MWLQQKETKKLLKITSKKNTTWREDGMHRSVGTGMMTIKCKEIARGNAVGLQLAHIQLALFNIRSGKVHVGTALFDVRSSNAAMGHASGTLLGVLKNAAMKQVHARTALFNIRSGNAAIAHVRLLRIARIELGVLKKDVMDGHAGTANPAMKGHAGAARLHLTPAQLGSGTTDGEGSKIAEVSERNSSNINLF